MIYVKIIIMNNQNKNTHARRKNSLVHKNKHTHVVRTH